MSQYHLGHNRMPIGLRFAFFRFHVRNVYLSIDSTGAYFVGPYPEARQCVGAERTADRDVGSVAAARDQHSADARRIVARVEGMPTAAEEGLEPRSEVHRAMRRRYTDV